MMDPIVLALARERDGYARSARPDRVIPVDEQLALMGWCVDADTNELVPIDKATRARLTRPMRMRERERERAVDPVRERAAE